MYRVVEYDIGAFFYKDKDSIKLNSSYKEFNKNNEPNKTIGYRLKPDGIGYCYYKERFNGDKKPEPAKEFIEFLKSMDIKNPYEMSFFHVYELDENGSILQELDPKDF